MPKGSLRTKQHTTPADEQKSHNPMPANHMDTPRTGEPLKQTNKHVRCGNRKGLLGRNDQTHHRMCPKTKDATPPIKRNTQAYIQLPRLQQQQQQQQQQTFKVQTVRRKQIRHQEDRDGSKANTMQSTNQARCPHLKCLLLLLLSGKSTSSVPPKMSRAPSKANTQAYIHLDFNQFLMRRTTRMKKKYISVMGSVLPGYMFRYQYCLVGGLEAIVFGSIRWCVWSFRPSSPLRLPHLKCLLLLLFWLIKLEP